jgi:putative transposase
VKRPWRTVKYEEAYLKAYEGVLELERSLKEYFIFYNEVRPHQSLGDKTPEKIDREVLDIKEEVH